MTFFRRKNKKLIEQSPNLIRDVDQQMEMQGGGVLCMLIAHAQCTHSKWECKGQARFACSLVNAPILNGNARGRRALHAHCSMRPF